MLSELENLVGSKHGYSSLQTEACCLFTSVVVVTELCIQHLTKHFFLSFFTPRFPMTPAVWKTYYE